MINILSENEVKKSNLPKVAYPGVTAVTDQ
jgi:hypothetical protein